MRNMNPYFTRNKEMIIRLLSGRSLVRIQSGVHRKPLFLISPEGAHRMGDGANPIGRTSKAGASNRAFLFLFSPEGAHRMGDEANPIRRLSKSPSFLVSPEGHKPDGRRSQSNRAYIESPFSYSARMLHTGCATKPAQQKTPASLWRLTSGIKTGFKPSSRPPTASSSQTRARHRRHTAFLVHP